MKNHDGMKLYYSILDIFPSEIEHIHLNCGEAYCALVHAYAACNIEKLGPFQHGSCDKH